MPFTLPPVEIGTGTGATTTCVITTTATASVGDVIVVIGGQEGGGAWTNVVDSAGNTYTFANAANAVNLTQSSSLGLLLAWTQLTSTLASGGTITVTLPSQNSFARAIVLPGAVVPAFDAKGTTANGTSTTFAPSVTTGNADDCLIGVLCNQTTASSPTTPTGWTPLTTIRQANVPIGFATHAWYQATSSTGAFTLSGSQTSQVYVAGILSFKSTIVAGASPVMGPTFQAIPFMR